MEKSKGTRYWTLCLLAVQIWAVIAMLFEVGDMIGGVEIGSSLYLLIACLAGAVILGINWEWCQKIIHRKKEQRETLKKQVSNGRCICQTILDPKCGFLNYTPFKFHLDMNSLMEALQENGIEFEIRESLFEFSDANNHDEILKVVLPIWKRLIKIENGLRLGREYAKI